MKLHLILLKTIYQRFLSPFIFVLKIEALQKNELTLLAKRTDSPLILRLNSSEMLIETPTIPKDSINELENFEYIPEKILARKIALFREIFHREPQITVSGLIDRLIEGLHQAGIIIAQSRSELYEGFRNQSMIMGDLLLQRLQQAFQFILKKAGVDFKKQITSNLEEQMQDCTKFQSKPFNYLLIFFKFNQDHCCICDCRSLLISFREIGLIFNCGAGLIQKFYQDYLENKTLIEKERTQKTTHRLILQYLLIKLKQQICKACKEHNFPDEASIQKQYLKVRFYYMNLRKKRFDNLLPKLHFSQICIKEKRSKQTNTRFEKEVRLKIRSLLQTNPHKQRLAEQKLKLIKHYNLGKCELQTLVKRQKKGEKFREQIFQQKKKLFIQLFTYYRYKKHHQYQHTIYAQMSKKCGQPNGIEKFIRVHCSLERKALKMRERQNYLHIMHLILSNFMKTIEVLFIDCFWFYKQHFRDCNILSNRPELTHSHTPFVHSEDLLLNLITGISNKRLVFYGIFEYNFNLQVYLKILKVFFDNSKVILPKVIAFRLPRGLEIFEWNKVSKLINHMERDGFLVFIILGQQISKNNINVKISNLLKCNIQAKFSQYFQPNKIPQFKTILKDYIENVLSNYDFSEVIGNFFKNEWTIQ